MKKFHIRRTYNDNYHIRTYAALKNPTEAYTKKVLNLIESREGIVDLIELSPPECRTDTIMLYAIQRNPYVISLMDSPSVVHITTSIKKSQGHTTELIHQHGWFDKQYWMLCVKFDGTLIRFTTDPPEHIQLAAVRNTGLALKHIENPSDKIQQVAWKNAGGLTKRVIRHKISDENMAICILSS